MMHIDWVSLILGCAAMVYGVANFFLSRKSPEKFRKLEPMKKLWGEKRGMLVHVIAYSVMPILLGIILLMLGLMGVSAF